MELDFNTKYELSQIGKGHELTELIGREPLSYQKIGEGFYGVVYLAEFRGDYGQVIIKWSKFGGLAANEKRQLELLRPHSLLKVPEVYHLLRGNGYELLVMEYIPGVNSSCLVEQDERVQAQFRELVIENLLALHRVKSEERPDSWFGHYSRQVKNIYRRLRREELSRSISTYVRKILESSLELLETALFKPLTAPSLIHSDYNLYNILADPVSYRPIGLIDPMYSCWGDSEFDLFHLNNGGGDKLALLEAYTERVECSEELSLKLAFYQLWDDLKHYANMAWYEESYFAARARSLEEELIE